MMHSVSDWCFLRAGVDPATYYEAVAAAGYDATEVTAPDHAPLVRRLGPAILNVSAPGTQSGLNRAEQEQILPAIRQTIDGAAAEGIPRMIVFSGNGRGADTDAGIDASAWHPDTHPWFAHDRRTLAPRSSPVGDSRRAMFCWTIGNRTAGSGVQL
jgi:sugar phosphate isomerase/epimerase